MSLCNVYIPANVPVLPVDVRTVRKVLLLPPASTVKASFLYVKDFYGSSFVNSITVSTVGIDRFDNSFSTLQITNNYGSVTLFSDGLTKWRTFASFNGKPSINTFTSFLPNQLSNCVLWLDAADSNTVILSGSDVTQWNDKSGLGNNANEISLTPPTYSASEKAVVLTAANGNFVRGDLNTTYEREACLFMVASYTSNSGSPIYLPRLFIAGIGGGYTHLLGQLNVIGQFDSPVVASYVPNNGNPTGYGTNLQTALVAKYSSPFVFTNLSAYNPTLERFTNLTFLDGTKQIYTQAYGTATTGVNYSSNYNKYVVGGYIEGEIDPNGDSYNGNIHEVILYSSTLNVEQRQQVEGYLAWKWNLQSNLPDTHLFKTYPPLTSVPPISTGIVTEGLEQNLDAATYVYENGSNWLASYGNFDLLYNRPRIGLSPGGVNTLVFNGSNQYAINQVGTSATTNYAFDIWYYTALSSATVVTELGQSGSLNTGYNAAVFQLVNNNGFVGFYNGSSSNTRLNLGILSTNVWNQVSWSYDGAVLTAFVNGNYINNVFAVKSAPPSGSYYAIASGTNQSNFGTSNYFKGEIGAVKFYNSVLTCNQVLQNYKAYAALRYGRSINPPPTPGATLNWFSNIDGDGGVTSNGGGSWNLSGPNDGGGNGWTYIYAQFAYATSFTYTYNYTSFDSPNFDWLFDSVSSAPASSPGNVDFNNVITTTSGTSGSRSLSVGEGQWVAIGLYSTDSCCGQAFVTLGGIPTSNVPPPPPPPFTNPSSLSNCSVWFDAAAATTITLQGGSSSNIASWKNQGIAGGFMTPYANNFVTGQLTINGCNAVLFDPSVAAQWTGALPSQDKTVFVVFKSLNNMESLASPGFNFLGGGNELDTQITTGYGFGLFGYTICLAGQWCWGTQNSSNPLYFTSSLLVSMRFTSTDLNSNFVHLNTSSINVGTNRLAGGFNEGSVNYKIGTEIAGTPRIALAEMIIYTRNITDTEVSLMESYLMQKWQCGGWVQPVVTALPPSIWFDGADLTSITYDPVNSNVLTWSNKGSNGYEALSNVSFSPPTVSPNTQNALNIVSYAANDNLYMDSFFVQNGNKSCFVVFKQNATMTSNQGIYFLAQETGGSFGDFTLLNSRDNATGGAIIATVNGGYCLPVLGISTQIVSQYQIVSLINTVGNDGTQGVWRNGSLLCNTFFCAAENNSLVTAYSLGKQTNGGPSYEFAEMKFYTSSFGSTGRQLVEGELAWKWGIESNLPVNHPYRYLSPYEPFYPFIWMDGSDLTTIQYDLANCNVTSWKNKGTSSNVALSNSSYTPPKAKQTTQNGLNVVTYSVGANLFIDSFVVPSGAKSCFAIFKQNAVMTSGSEGIAFLQARDGFNFGDFTFMNAYATGGNTAVATVNGGYCFPVVGFPPEQLSFQIVSVIATNSDDGSQGVWRDGTFIDNTFNCPSENTTASLPYSVGRGTAGINPSYEYAEMRIYASSFGTAGRQNVEGELAWKWGLQTSLPNTHPYRFLSPNFNYSPFTGYDFNFYTANAPTISNTVAGGASATIALENFNYFNQSEAGNYYLQIYAPYLDVNPTGGVVLPSLNNITAIEVWINYPVQEFYGQYFIDARIGTADAYWITNGGGVEDNIGPFFNGGTIYINTASNAIDNTSPGSPRLAPTLAGTGWTQIILVPLTSFTDDVSLFQNSGGNQGMPLYVADIAVYNYPMNQSTVKGLYNQKCGRYGLSPVS